MTGWPAVEGDYVVGDPEGSVAVCVLTSAELKTPLARLAGVAIAGTLQTANLGVERVVQNVVANSQIRFLLVCGKDSKLFRPGDALRSLISNGIGASGEIVATRGFEPFLRNVAVSAVERFRRQVELEFEAEETDREALSARIADLAGRDPGAFDEPPEPIPPPPAFKKLRPGGRREPLQYDPDGLFVITTEAPDIVVRHYSTERRPLHEMRGRNASSLLLGLLRENLVSQLSHAGYLGQELEKAQLAIKTGATYEQDRPLKVNSAIEFNGPLEVTAVEGNSLEAVILEPDPASPYDTFRRTERTVSATWGTKIAMGGWDDVRPGALLRLRGLPDAEGVVQAQGVAVLTNVARLSAETT